MGKTLAQALDELRRDPGHPVRARIEDVEVELRAVGSAPPPRSLGAFLASLGPWEGESADDLLARLRTARDAEGSAEPPAL